MPVDEEKPPIEVPGQLDLLDEIPGETRGTEKTEQQNQHEN